MIRLLAATLIFFAAAAGPAAAQRAVVRGLDKVTGHAADYTLTLGRAARIGSLEVVARACSKTAPEEIPEVKIYLQVYDNSPAREGGESERRQIFSGWMFASSPGLNALEHPTYDIWAIDCRS
ncbi:MAG: DUF2155 domain-containing protein [Vitreimonas sp.]